jgi:hypothetical protein
VNEFGADTLRTYEMFIGAFDLSAAWSNEGVKGCRRFMERVWKLRDMVTAEEGYSADLEIKLHQTIKKVSQDFENMKYNTAIAAMMALVNEFYKKSSVTKGEFKTLILLLNPVAPHMTEELWQLLGEQGRVYQQKWPVYDEQKTVEDTVEIAVQINGKVKANLMIALDEKQEDVEARAKELDPIKNAMNGKTIVKVIYVPGIPADPLLLRLILLLLMTVCCYGLQVLLERQRQVLEEENAAAARVRRGRQRLVACGSVFLQQRARPNRPISSAEFCLRRNSGRLRLQFERVCDRTGILDLVVLVALGGSG